MQYKRLNVTSNYMKRERGTNTVNIEKVREFILPNNISKFQL